MAFAIFAPRPNSHPFQERQLSLKEPIKIGRAVAKAKATQTNGIFDCKVLSRNHAMLWYENGKFMLQDTKSSNGTYVNNVRLSLGAKESEPCEVKSGDILQFGVEVVENSKNVTHGCIIGLATLFNEDGTEATGGNDESQGILSLLNVEKGIQPNELWQLSQFLQDALHREQMLENKLATLQRMISNSHTASEETFQGFIQEDKVLSRLETLENQLEIFSKDLTEEEMKTQLINYQGERLQYESEAKETLQKILNEKIDALQKCSDLERLLSNAEDECTFLKTSSETSKEELNELMKKYRQTIDEMTQLKDELASSKQKHESMQQQTTSEKQELKLLLDEAEKRGSSLAVEVESLQAECDFTKQQLESMKERLEQKQKAIEEEDTEKHDPPFASDHATLEKDVKNKTALIKSLKDQLSELQIQLDMERNKVDDQSLSDDAVVIDDIPVETSSKDHDVSLEVLMENMKELKALMNSTRRSFQDFQHPTGDLDFSAADISFRDTNSSQDVLKKQDEVIVRCSNFLRSINKNKVSLKIPNGLGENSTDESIKEQLSDAHSELKEVRRQILELGEQLIEEQKVNKKSKELASNLELKLIDEHWKSRQFRKILSSLCKQLNEAHDEMEKENIDSSSKPFASVQEALKLAGEMKTQVAAYDNKSYAENIVEENENMKGRLALLEKRCGELKKENALLLDDRRNRRKSTPPCLTSSVSKLSINQVKSEPNTSDVSDYSFEDLQEQLSQVNQSLEELFVEKKFESERFKRQKSQMVNVILTLVLVILIFFAFVVLGLVDISPGLFPLLDEHTWSELLEHLF